MKYCVEIRNPRRPVSYLGRNGFVANPSEAHAFRASYDDEVNAHVATLYAFLHLDDLICLRRIEN